MTQKKYSGIDYLTRIVYLPAILLCLLISPLIAADGSKLLLDLRGHWKFEIGDKIDWADPAFDDSSWGSIFVPAKWEDEGYAGYDGYAWYRKSFHFTPPPNAEMVTFDLGFVDDVCEVFLNGKRIGINGKFPPNFETAYNAPCRILVPRTHFKEDGSKNILALRVYDSHLEGGIIRGRVGFMAFRESAPVSISLTGFWKLRRGDPQEASAVQYDDSDWQTVVAPMPWETIWNEDYDGFAWYRKQFFLPDSLSGTELYLLLGKIDDMDETFFNGEKIGQTGVISNSRPRPKGWEYQEIRAYKIPAELLRYGQQNLISIRVFDGLVDGGIYSGPLGIIREKPFNRWLRQNEHGKQPGFWIILRDMLFE